MCDSLLTVTSFYWGPDGEFRPPLALDPAGRTGTAPAQVEGRFALASSDQDGSVVLVRDRLGLNKLFVAVDDTGTIRTASYAIDLVRHGIPFECIHSVPPGYVVRAWPACGAIQLHRYRDVNETSGSPAIALDDVARAIRTRLDSWFGRLAAQFAARRIRICLSGGLDSGIVAAFARKYFADVTAYTYAFTEPGTAPSEDAVSATRLADALGIPLRCVPASARDVLAVVEDALCYGQDWRDFNVHCAVVNELLARAIRRDADDDPAAAESLVLTGDLANELLADYTPVTYGRQQFYALPDVGVARLRSALVRGLDAGDREVGIFARHGLDVIQPYSLLADEYLRLPAALLGRDGIKQELSRRIAGDLLPGFVFDRIKVRAQIGNSTQPTGILPVLLEHGYDASWLRRTFCRMFGIRREAALDGFIRAGRYRVINRSFDGASSHDSVAV
jgi:asparagine synthetase B (glutamine-hydrolysing)